LCKKQQGGEMRSLELFVGLHVFLKVQEVRQPGQVDSFSQLSREGWRWYWVDKSNKQKVLF
jgi:hypothetical protein